MQHAKVCEGVSYERRYCWKEMRNGDCDLQTGASLGQTLVAIEQE